MSLKLSSTHLQKESRCIAIVTGSKGEYGYIRPILRAIEKDSDLEYRLIVTNMHLLPEFGYSIQDIIDDGFIISDTIYMAFDGYTNASMSKSLGAFLLSVSDAFLRLKPDLILLAGDRGEQLMAAISGTHMNIPIAHIQAGELSGNIDGITRHAITKFAHLHFASNEDALERLKKMGEQDFRIFNTGAPQLDELVSGYCTSRENLVERLSLDLSRPLIIMIQHPVIEEIEELPHQIQETLEAVAGLKEQTIIIFPNSDAGSELIRSEILRRHLPFVHIYRNIRREDFIGLMKIASAIIGNSSCGIIEAPLLKLPTVNIGNRQRGRMQANNVLNVGHDKEGILSAIKQALSKEFRESLKDCVSSYGDGHTTERIIKILKEIPIDETLLKKNMTY